MIFRIFKQLVAILLVCMVMSSCTLLRQNSKYNFNDGVYHTGKLTNKKVYVLNIDEDTIAVFPVVKSGDSTIIVTAKRVNHVSTQRKLKDNKAQHTFYRPSLDLDLLAMPIKYRPAINGFPNQLNTTFNGALYGGYRLDAYTLKYKRTPLNSYKQSVKHFGCSAGFYAGIGSTLADASTIDIPNFPLQYEGVLLITGIAANIAVENLSFGLSLGTDHLLDKYHANWLYQGQPCIGLTLGLNLN